MFLDEGVDTVVGDTALQTAARCERDVHRRVRVTRPPDTLASARGSGTGAALPQVRLPQTGLQEAQPGVRERVAGKQNAGHPMHGAASLGREGREGLTPVRTNPEDTPLRGRSRTQKATRGGIPFI